MKVNIAYQRKRGGKKTKTKTNKKKKQKQNKRKGYIEQSTSYIEIVA